MCGTWHVKSSFRFSNRRFDGNNAQPLTKKWKNVRDKIILRANARTSCPPCSGKQIVGTYKTKHVPPSEYPPDPSAAELLLF